MNTSTFGSAFLTLAITCMVSHASAQQSSETDDRIEAAAKASYVFRTHLIDDSVQTDAKEGVVTLTGNVKEISHKQLAEETVAGLPGVKSVENKIETKDAPPENSDTWLYLKVKSTLAYHRSVSAFNTQVEMKEGTAILKGEATSQAQKDLVTEYTKDIIGIKGVSNLMTITTPSKDVEPTLAMMIDDASITAQVRMVLLSHRATSNLRTMVATNEGVVTLAGNANNAAEVSLVTKLVTDIHGVKSVVNNMTVAVSSSGN